MPNFNIGIDAGATTCSEPLKPDHSNRLAAGVLGIEYLRPAQAAAVFSISRSKVYEPIRSGAVASVSLREEGQTKGTRLLSVASLRRFFESRTEGGEAATA